MRAARRLQISQRCPPSRGLAPFESARGPVADRRAKLLIQFAVEGSLSGAYAQRTEIFHSSLGSAMPGHQFRLKPPVSLIRRQPHLARWPLREHPLDPQIALANGGSERLPRLRQIRRLTIQPSDRRLSVHDA